jgi:hypothetical protein
MMLPTVHYVTPDVIPGRRIVALDKTTAEYSRMVGLKEDGTITFAILLGPNDACYHLCVGHE